MIGFLRFLGLLNAAVWFGAAVFFVLGAWPATTSRQLQELIGQNNFPYYSVAIGQILAGRFLSVYMVCSVVGVLHLLAEWLYFGKYPPRIWLALVLGLCLMGIFQGLWLQPTLKRLHQLSFSPQTRAEQRELSLRSFRAWRVVSHGLDWVVLGALAVYVWRVGNPADPMRFVSTSKFRS